MSPIDTPYSGSPASSIGWKCFLTRNLNGVVEHLSGIRGSYRLVLGEVEGEEQLIYARPDPCPRPRYDPSIILMPSISPLDVLVIPAVRCCGHCSLSHLAPAASHKQANDDGCRSAPRKCCRKSHLHRDSAAALSRKESTNCFERISGYSN